MFGLSAAFQQDMPNNYHRVLVKCKIHSSSDESGTASLIDVFLLARELDQFRLFGQVHKVLPKSTTYPKVILEIASSLHLKQQTCWGRSETGISKTILDRTPSINSKTQKLSLYNHLGWEAKSPHIFFSCRLLDRDVSDEILTDNCGVMCLVCVLFSNTVDVQATTGSLSNFIGKPFNNYKQGSCLNDHLESPTHLFCLQVWNEVITRDSAPPIPVTDVRHGFLPHNAVAKAGRELLLSIVLHTARQGIALRGSVDYSNSDVKACIFLNRASNTTLSLPSCGNFLSTVIWIASSLSQELFNYFQKTSVSALWLSPSCQNRMLHYLADNIREYNNKQIKAAQFFSVMFDESQNLAKNSILAIGERYYDKLQRAPLEVITSYLQLPKQNADTIANALIRQIERNLAVRGLPDSAFVSCTADGCGTNTGCNNGVIVQLKRRFGAQLIFIWCHLHRLNLVLMNSLCLHEKETRLLSIVMSNNVKACDELIRWINFSSKRNSDFALTCQSMDYSEVTMKELCRTRWIERILGIQVFTAYIAPIVQFLWNMVHKTSEAEYSSKDKALALSFLKGIQTYPFLLSLIVFRDLICLYEPMTRELQGVRVDMPRARRAARNILQIIREYRTVKLNHFCNIIFRSTETICGFARSKAEIESKMFNIQAVPPRCAVRSVFRENHRPDNYSEMTMKDRAELFYRDSLIIPILDRMTAELMERFENEDAVEVWNLAIACSPYDQIRDLLKLLPDNQTDTSAFQRARFEKDLLPFTAVVQARGNSTASATISVPVPLLQQWKASLIAGVVRFRRTLCDLNYSEITAIVSDPTGSMLTIQIDSYIDFWLHQSPGTLFDTRDMAENISFMESHGLLCPVIVSLTMLILSCAATSVTPERGFSWEHFISTKFRTKTKIGRLSNLVMLYSNSRIPIDLVATHKTIATEQWSEMDVNHGDSSQVRPPNRLHLKKSYSDHPPPVQADTASAVVPEGQDNELIFDEAGVDTAEDTDFDGDLDDPGTDGIVEPSLEPTPRFEHDEELAPGEYIVEKILNRRAKGRGYQYLVKWLNHDDALDNTWEPGSGLPEQSLEDYNKKFPLT